MKKRWYVLLSLVLVMALMLTGCGKGGDYKKAMTMYENGQYEEAAMKFTELGDYENSKEMVKTCNYEAAKVLFDGGSFEDAKKAFAELGDYENSAKYVKDCDYNMATALYDAGDYEAAIAIYETISDYNDSAAKIQAANKELMYKNFGDVLTALDGNTWFFNGGSDTILNGISFSGEEATIAQVYFDGNGKHDNGSNTYAYIVDDKNVVVTMADGTELEISYTLANGEVTLGEKEYFSLQEVEAGIQGYWNMRNSSTVLGMKTVTDKSIYFNNGKVVSENASLAYGSTSGEYYYYGPYEGSYTLNFGGLDTDMSHGSEWFFNIVDGKVVVINYDHVCKPADKLPGEKGYKF